MSKANVLVHIEWIGVLGERKSNPHLGHIGQVSRFLHIDGVLAYMWSECVKMVCINRKFFASNISIERNSVGITCNCQEHFTGKMCALNEWLWKLLGVKVHYLATQQLIGSCHVSHLHSGFPCEKWFELKPFRSEKVIRVQYSLWDRN